MNDDADYDMAAEIEDDLIDQVLPIMDELDEKYEGGAYFAMFVNCVHIMMNNGWTGDELLEEVRAHIEIHNENVSDMEPGDLH